MVELATLQAVSYIMGSLGVFAAAVYYILNIQNNKRNQELVLKTQQQQLETRQAQLFMAIYDKIETRENTELLLEVLGRTFDSVGEFHEKYGPETNPKAYHDWLHCGNMLDGLGVLVREGFVDTRLVALLMSGAVTGFWETYEAVIKDFRERGHWPRTFIELEHLYKEVVEYGRKHPELEIK